MMVIYFSAPEYFPKTMDVKVADVARDVGPDWQRFARTLEIPDCDIRQIRQEYPGNEALTAIIIWIERTGNAANS